MDYVNNIGAHHGESIGLVYLSSPRLDLLFRELRDAVTKLHQTVDSISRYFHFLMLMHTVARSLSHIPPPAPL